MTLNPLNHSNLEQLALKGLMLTMWTSGQVVSVESVHWRMYWVLMSVVCSRCTLQDNTTTRNYFSTDSLLLTQLYASDARCCYAIVILSVCLSVTVVIHA